MNILITGGAGFVGSELAKFLLAKEKGDCVVKILDNLEYGYRENFEDNAILRKNFIKADVRDSNFVDYLEDIDVVYHLAGISSLPECESNPAKAYSVNTSATANVLDACRKKGISKVIFSSTSAVYENNLLEKVHCESEVVAPNLIYSSTKYAAEGICRSFAENYGMNIIICRFFNVFGPHQDFRRKYPPFTSYLVREALSGRVPTIYNTSKVKRDYIYTEDLLTYLWLMLHSDRHYKAEIFNLCSGTGHVALDIAKQIYELLNCRFEYNTGSSRKFWEKYPELFDSKYPLSEDRVEREVYKNCIGSVEKLTKEFSYIPKYDMKSGLKAIIDYQSKLSQKN